MPTIFRKAAGASTSPVDLLPPAAQNTFEFRDGANPKNAPGSFTRVREAGGRPVFLATNGKGSSNTYAITTSWQVPAAIAKGDTILVRLMMRALSARQESGEAEGLIYVQGGSEREATQSFSVGPDWTQINVPFAATGDRAAGTAQLSIAFSNLPQSFEIAGIEMLSFGQRVPLAQLPVTRFTYAGRESDAAWRTAALARIEELRTAPIAVKVVDQRGRPVPGATVDLAMTRSEFLWGSSVGVDRLLAPGADSDRYRALVTELFDTAVIENGLKWPIWRRGPQKRKDALQAIDWLAARGLRVKGHTLAWPAWKFSPKDIVDDPARGEKIGALVTAHIKDITAATKGRLIGWDVVNEPIHETDYWQHIPRESVADWFKLARESEPELRLTLNEYGMLNRSSSPIMIGEMLEFARMAESRGAKIDILGVQAHVGQTPRPPAAGRSPCCRASPNSRCADRPYPADRPDSSPACRSWPPAGEPRRARPARRKPPPAAPMSRAAGGAEAWAWMKDQSLRASSAGQRRVGRYGRAQSSVTTSSRASLSRRQSLMVRLVALPRTVTRYQPRCPLACTVPVASVVALSLVRQRPSTYSRQIATFGFSLQSARNIAASGFHCSCCQKPHCRKPVTARWLYSAIRKSRVYSACSTSSLVLKSNSVICTSCPPAANRSRSVSTDAAAWIGPAEPGFG